MDEWVEEIRLISRVSPVRKLALVRPRRDRRELMYQLNRYKEDQKNQITNLVKKKIPDVSKSNDSSTVSNSNDSAANLKKRIAFDRAIIIGD